MFVTSSTQLTLSVAQKQDLYQSCAAVKARSDVHGFQIMMLRTFL